MSPAPNEWDLARRLDTLSLNIGRHPRGFLVVFLVTSYSSISSSAPPSLHNSLYFNASFRILGSYLFIAVKSPQTRQGCNTARAFVSGRLAGGGTFSREGIARAAGGLCPEQAAALKGWRRIFQGANPAGFWVGALIAPRCVENWSETLGASDPPCSDLSGSSQARAAPKTPVPGQRCPAGLRGWALRCCSAPLSSSYLKHESGGMQKMKGTLFKLGRRSKPLAAEAGRLRTFSGFEEGCWTRLDIQRHVCL